MGQEPQSLRAEKIAQILGWGYRKEQSRVATAKMPSLSAPHFTVLPSWDLVCVCEPGRLCTQGKQPWTRWEKNNNSHSACLLSAHLYTCRHVHSPFYVILRSALDGRTFLSVLNWGKLWLWGIQTLGQSCTPWEGKDLNLVLSSSKTLTFWF